jgi:hypothetical protein
MSIRTMRTATFTRVLVVDFCFRSADPEAATWPGGSSGWTCPGLRDTPGCGC